MKKTLFILSLIAILIIANVQAYAVTDESNLNEFMGTYRGSYYANQGHTGLTLKVYMDENNDYKAEFYFYSVPENPSVPSGKYLCDVSYNNSNDTFYVKGTEWIEKPSTYVFVDLEGVYENKTYVGTVYSTGSSRTFSFDLTKQEGDNAPSEWAEVTVEDAILSGVVPLELQKDYKYEITRAEFARLVVAALSLETGKEIEEILNEKAIKIDKNAFDDTDDSFVLSAHALGILNGYGNKKFGPNDLITREQAATMLTKLANVLNVFEPNGTPLVFADRNTFSEWAKKSIDFVSGTIEPTSNTPIMNGYNNKFNPKASYSNEQAFITIYKLINSIPY